MRWIWAVALLAAAAHGWTEWTYQGGVERLQGFYRLYYNMQGYDNRAGLLWRFPSPQQDVTVSFEYRMSSGDVGGSKLLKMFGGSGAGEVSNVTFNQMYTSGDWVGASFGDNVKGPNDTQNVIRFDGSNNTQVLIKTATRKPSRREQEDWHKARMRWRQNDDGQRNGAVDIWIDGELRLSAAGFRNRGDGHSFLRWLVIGDYTHNLKNGGKSFYMDVRNMLIEGEQAESLPSPPVIALD